MKERVMATAKILNYKPNAVARSLRKKTSSKLIGIIIPELSHYFYSTIVKGVTSGSREDDYSIIIGESNHDVTREMELIDQYSDHYVAGLVFVPSRDAHSYDNVKELVSRQVPFVLIDRTFDAFQGSYIRYDDYHGAQWATLHLLDQGCTRIGLLRGHDDCSISSARFKGYRDALAQYNIDFNPALVMQCPEASKSEAYNACQKLWNCSPPPDAIFTITDQLAAGVYDFAHDNNLDIPRDMAVVGYSNSEISDILYPRLTTVKQNGQELGLMAKEHLIHQINNPSLKLQKTIATELIIRGSSKE